MNKVITVCKYQMRGTCRFGDSCRFSHSESIPSTNEYQITEQYQNTCTRNSTTNSLPTLIGGCVVCGSEVFHNNTGEDHENKEKEQNHNNRNININKKSNKITNSSSNLNLNLNNESESSSLSVPKITVNSNTNWAMAPIFVPRQKKSRQGSERNQPLAIPIEVIEIADDDDDMGSASGTSGAAAVTSTIRPFSDDYDSLISHFNSLPMSKLLPPNITSPMGTEFASGSASACASGFASGSASACASASTSGPTSPSTSGSTSSAPESTSGSASSSKSIYYGKSYAEVLNGGGSVRKQTSTPAIKLEKKSSQLCPYEVYCTYGKDCVFQHGELCELCGRYSLHPNDKEQRRKHINDCIKQHEKDMEISFAIARSKDKTCGVCFDVIMEKTGREKRFGILPNCNHVFCLTCIRKWRQAKQFEIKITRACPECRTPSDFVCPSPYWVDTKEDKQKLIEAYKLALGKKDCKYFARGEGKCPFGNKCFYKHALSNGQLVDVGVPQKRRIHRSDDEILELFDQVFPQIYLWNFVERRNFEAARDAYDSDTYSESEEMDLLEMDMLEE